MRFILSVFTSIFITLSAAHGSDETSTINFNISLECPPSPEREALESIIPSPEYQSSNLQEWIQTTLNELDHVRALVQSGHFKNANVNFGSNNRAGIDESKLESVNISFSLTCLECAATESLKKLSHQNEKKLSYPQWSINTMKTLQNIELLILNENIVGVNSQWIKTKGENQPLVEIIYKTALKGPVSEELQDLLNALLEENQTFENYQEWSQSMVNIIHKLELLILSGKINLAESRIDVVDINS